MKNVRANRDLPHCDANLELFKANDALGELERVQLLLIGSLLDQFNEPVHPINPLLLILNWICVLRSPPAVLSKRCQSLFLHFLFQLPLLDAYSNDRA